MIRGYAGGRKHAAALGAVLALALPDAARNLLTKLRRDWDERRQR
jgi:hypothetical protein